MWRAPFTVVGAVVVTALIASAPRAPAADAGSGLRLTATGDETGWIALGVRGGGRGAVVLRELTGGRTTTIARLTLHGGAAERHHARRWRCERRVRRFVATTRGAGAQSASATITTPSCAQRLRMIVVPARVRPGHDVSVRVTDTWRFGAISATVCARKDGDATNCKRARLPARAITRRVRLRLEQPGPRTITLRSPFGQRLATAIEVRDHARLHVLVTGDSMILGLFGTLASDLGPVASVLGDPHPGRGITTPGYLDWPAHARRSARTDRPDVTVVFLGSADAGYPLTTEAGAAVTCCDRPWVAEYARRVSTMMAAWLRDGRGLVYWVLLPAPRSPTKATVARAENDAVRLAARGFDDGVEVVERVADVLAPHGRYTDAIRIDGHMEIVRDEDGVHLAPLGIQIATDVISQRLRDDDLLALAG